MTRAIRRGLIEVHDPSEDLLQSVQQEFTQPNPAFFLAEAQKRSTAGVDRELRLYTWDEEERVLRFPRHHSQPIQVEDLCVAPYLGPVATAFTPRRLEQGLAVDAVTAALEFTLDDGVLIAPTGEGKTVMAVEIACRLGLRTAILVHADHLADAFVETILWMLPGTTPEDIGLVRGSTMRLGARFTIISIPTLLRSSRLPPELPSAFGLVIGDEVHRQGAPQWGTSVGRFAAKKRLGLTATADRRDGLRSVYRAHFGDVLYEIETAAITPDVHIVETDYEVPLRDIVSPVCGTCRKHLIVTREGDARCSNSLCEHPLPVVEAPKSVSALAKLRPRNERILALIRKAIAAGRQILVLSDRIEQLSWFAEQLGPDLAGLYVENASSKAKKAALAVARTKQVLLATYGKVAEGFDEPRLNTLVLATPRADTRQPSGRITRDPNMNPRPLLVDIADPKIPPFDKWAHARRRMYARENWRVLNPRSKP